MLETAQLKKSDAIAGEIIEERLENVNFDFAPALWRPNNT